MKITDQIVAWLILILGIIHCAFTPAFTVAAMWFLGAGLFIILLGALNLLRIRYAAVAGGVQAVAIAANVVALAYTIAIALEVNLRANPQAILMLVLLALATVFSAIPRKRAQEPDKLATAR